MLPEVPRDLPRHNFTLVKPIAAQCLKFIGWKVRGKFPEQKKIILIVAPHTSNWDFFIAMLVMFALDIKVTFLGKHTIFVWPVNRLLRSLGGVPIERSSSHGVVKQMSNLFEEREQMILGLAPEGTRSKTRDWKRGFLHIALASNVPVVPISLDFKKKEVEIKPAQVVSSDMDASLAKIKALYSDVCAKNPHLV